MEGGWGGHAHMIAAFVIDENNNKLPRVRRKRQMHTLHLKLAAAPPASELHLLLLLRLSVLLQQPPTPTPAPAPTPAEVAGKVLSAKVHHAQVLKR